MIGVPPLVLNDFLSAVLPSASRKFTAKLPEIPAPAKKGGFRRRRERSYTLNPQYMMLQAQARKKLYPKPPIHDASGAGEKTPLPTQIFEGKIPKRETKGAIMVDHDFSSYREKSLRSAGAAADSLHRNVQEKCLE
jgi:hypothetical protein